MHSTDGIRAAVDTMSREVALLGERARPGEGKDRRPARLLERGGGRARARPGPRVPEVPAVREHRDAGRDPLRHLLGEARPSPGHLRRALGGCPMKRLVPDHRRLGHEPGRLGRRAGVHAAALELRSSSRGWRSLCFLADGSQREIPGGSADSLMAAKAAAVDQARGILGPLHAAALPAVAPR